MPEKVKKLMAWYERRLAPVAFLAGFAFDALTLTRVDLLRDNLILIAHLTVAAAGIALVNAVEASRLKGAFTETIAWLFPLMIQFSFGALFSGFVVLYFRSGSLAGSWLFLLLLTLLLIGNEFFRRHYRRLTFHLNVYFIALFAYLILAIPMLVNRMGAAMFLASGLASLALIALFIGLMGRMAPHVSQYRRELAASIGGIYLTFNLLYFLNVIPPIPLALKEIGIYHAAVPAPGGGYRVSFEKPQWYEFFRDTSKTFQWVPGTPVFAYSAIFAPANINTAIFHHWEYFDTEAGEWIEKSRISYPIAGGRDGGYRGYSMKQIITPGKWRVAVKTGRGQLLGRTAFEIVETGVLPLLETRDL